MGKGKGGERREGGGGEGEEEVKGWNAEEGKKEKMGFSSLKEGPDARGRRTRRARAERRVSRSRNVQTNTKRVSTKRNPPGNDKKGTPPPPRKLFGRAG